MPALVTVALYLFLALSAAALVKVRSIASDEWLPRTALAAICVLYGASGPTLYGLEYEDAFVHQASGLWRSGHWIDSQDGFYTTICFLGSAFDCAVQGSYGTHMIGAATLVAILDAVLSGLPSGMTVISVTASVLVVQVLWSIFVKEIPNSLARTVAIAALLSSPAFYLVSGSGFAEPLCTSLLLVFLWSYLRTTRWRAASLSNAVWLLLLSSGALAVLVKKEALLLVIIMPLYDITAIATRRWDKRSIINYWPSFLSCLVLVVFSVLVVRVLDAVSRHEANIAAPAFQLEYVWRLLPAMGEAALAAKTFGLLGWMTLASVPVAVGLRDRFSGSMICVVAGYLLLYSSHARHQSFINGEPVHPDEMIRYLYVIAPFAVLLVARTLSSAFALTFTGKQWLSRPLRPLQISSIIVGAAVLPVPSIGQQRAALAAEEFRSRIGVVGLQDSSNEVVYLSTMPAVVTAIGGRNAFVAELAMLREPRNLAWLLALRERGVAIVPQTGVCTDGPSAYAICKFIGSPIP